jgi:hypothetical protein
MTISTDRDRVRLLVGDTDATDPLLFDDEIAHFVDTRSITTTAGTTVNVIAAAADCAGAIAGKFSREYSFREDSQGFERQQKVSHYRSLETTLRSRAGGQTVPLTLGGTITSS